MLIAQASENDLSDPNPISLKTFKVEFQTLGRKVSSRISRPQNKNFNRREKVHEVCQYAGLRGPRVEFG